MKTFVQSLTDENWEKKVLQEKKPVLIMHFSPNCPHCKNIEPYFEQYAEEFEGKIVFGRLNLTQNMQIAAKYRIMGTPTFTFFCHGKLISHHVGEMYPSLIKKLIEDGLRHGEDCALKTTWIDHDITGYA